MELLFQQALGCALEAWCEFLASPSAFFSCWLCSRHLLCEWLMPWWNWSFQVNLHKWVLPLVVFSQTLLNASVQPSLLDNNAKFRSESISGKCSSSRALWNIHPGDMKLVTVSEFQCVAVLCCPWQQYRNQRWQWDYNWSCMWKTYT